MRRFERTYAMTVDLSDVPMREVPGVVEKLREAGRPRAVDWIGMRVMVEYDIVESGPDRFDLWDLRGTVEDAAALLSASHARFVEERPVDLREVDDQPTTLMRTVESLTEEHRLG